MNSSTPKPVPRRKPARWKFLETVSSFFSFRRDGDSKVGEMYYPKQDPNIPPGKTAEEALETLAQQGLRKAIPYRYTNPDHIQHVLLLMKAVAQKNIAPSEINEKIVSRLLDEIQPLNTTPEQRKKFGFFYLNSEPDHSQVRAAARSLRDVIKRQFLVQLAPSMFEIVAVGNYTTLTQHYAIQILESLGVSPEEMRKALFDVRKIYPGKQKDGTDNE